MAAIFGEGKIFGKITKSTMLRKFENFENGRHFWGGENFWKNYQEHNAQIPCGSKILTKSLYLARLRR